MTDRQDAQGTLGTLDLVDDAETPDSVSPQSLEFAAQQPPKFWIVTEREPEPGDPTHTQCGFIAAGDCGDFAPQHACKKFSAHGFYKDCHDQPMAPHQVSKKFGQVITTFVQP